MVIKAHQSQIIKAVIKFDKTLIIVPKKANKKKELMLSFTFIKKLPNKINIRLKSYLYK